MNNRPRSLLAKYSRTISFIAIGFAIGFSIGFLISYSQNQGRIAEFELPQESLELLNEFYFGMLPESIELQRGMTRGLLDAIDDPYTTYLDPATNELEANTLQGAYGGIGAFITPTRKGWAIVPFDEGPAHQAGVHDGDILVAVDDVSITPSFSEVEITAALRGEVGTSVTIKISRHPDQVLTFTIPRQNLPLASANSYLFPEEPTIGVLNLTGFGSPAKDEVLGNIRELNSHGAQAIILDVRDNPGGLLDSALDVADLFLSDGIIVTEVSYDGERTKHLASASAEDISLPLAVLVNGGTASAAEVLAAALQGNQRALLFGQPTFGKGSVQSIYGLGDGSSLHITTARWFNPSGEAIDQMGIQPDKMVEPATGANDPALHEAIVHLKAVIKEQP